MSTCKAFINERKGEDCFYSEFTHPYSVKEIIGHLTPLEFQHCIELAASALEHVRTHALDTQFKEATEVCERKYNEEKQKIQADHVAKLEAQNLRILQVEDELKVESQLRHQLQSSNSKMFENLLDSAFQPRVKQYETEIANLKGQYQQVSQNLTKMVEAREKESLNREQQMQRDHASSVADIKSTLEKYKADYDARAENMKSDYEKQIAELRSHTSSSTAIGKHGEQQFESLAKTHKQWTLQRTSHQPYATDFACNIRGCEVRFEIKNYKSNIPLTEVDKFHRDMTANPDVSLGVFVSMKTQIAGMADTGYLYVDWGARSQMLLFIQSFYSHAAEDIFDLIDICIDIANKIQNDVKDRLPDSDDAHDFSSKINRVKEIVNAQIKSIDNLKKLFNFNKKALLELVNKQHTECLNEIVKVSASLNLAVTHVLSEQHGTSALPEGTSIAPKRPRVDQNQS